MGQERAAVNPAEYRLKADPFHKVIKCGIPCVECDIVFILPVSLCLLQRFLHFLFTAKALHCLCRDSYRISL